ncbi:hypothetical protein HYFRA_00005436 [Hymenoscyphus fraxineus]|uniref:Uncharacterized protein n=1 Tax=Hymenoscyphus fraxineus TaxID=746836 RepID=A0A9N9PLW8_9HELO|nr:hypothetical protein HYFRA_00005436 [Hymenoscyphus fraxineus]
MHPFLNEIFNHPIQDQLVVAYRHLGYHHVTAGPVPITTPARPTTTEPQIGYSPYGIGHRPNKSLLPVTPDGPGSKYTENHTALEASIRATPVVPASAFAVQHNASLVPTAPDSSNTKCGQQRHLS